VGRASETVSKLGKQQKEWYGEGGYCPSSPHPTLSQRERALSFRAVAGPLSLRERTRVRVLKKERATLLTFAAIPRQFRPARQC